MTIPDVNFHIETLGVTISEIQCLHDNSDSDSARLEYKHLLNRLYTLQGVLHDVRWEQEEFSENSY